ncbi:MAG: hypothetical protein A2741_00410 [Candidatus Zambryskibacteria bacterium RIFCSPHIGHO2_01_FULL_43_27]|uniref:Methyltransferase FkbM domain-containing protein n=1 Tax=Candidatus Zambryskibacteria bacterium RIFCSPLOWO2_01_FULL_43_17 TaxID=1802760 RepID=A0A1G2U215_9BACT|nr:MAG: hypothetical protein A2741_00410 [Candidatus Zambryskibacteria bacterium RIFCSPHIGHO2_01_FULL_43_27]OHB03556.1 MAG: hypothetical protein A2920_02745 [Candidatus Zambryskibacteria bacterium RIFCSPLOWO2_01_FULL_43_17]
MAYNELQMPISSRDNLLEISAFLKRGFNFIKARYAPRGARISFSGSGEDLIMYDFLANKGIDNFSYIDIGAHHPFFGNNTYLFYRKGGRGVLVEPNSIQYREILRVRGRDKCLNVGVGRENGESAFYTFSRNTRNTFSQSEAHAWEAKSGEKAKVEKRKIFSLDYIIENFCVNIPHIISIDTEGYEVEVLSGFSWKKRPLLFCIEVIASSGSIFDSENVDNPVYKIMEDQGYKLIAKTPVNAIFADSRAS